MSAMGMLTARQWAQAVGLVLVLAVMFVAAVAVVLPTLALALSLALLMVGAAVVARRVAAVARAASTVVIGNARASDEPARPTLLVELADGELLSARAVPMPRPGEHTLALTRDGYVVLGAEGRVIHKLSGRAVEQ